MGQGLRRGGVNREVTRYATLLNMSAVPVKGRDTTEGGRTHGLPGRNLMPSRAGSVPGPSTAVAKCVSLPAIPAQAAFYPRDSRVSYAGNRNCVTDYLARGGEYVAIFSLIREIFLTLRVLSGGYHRYLPSVPTTGTRCRIPPAGDISSGGGQHDRRASRRPRDGEARHGREATAPGTPTGREARPEGFGECDSPECDRRAVVVVRHPLLEDGALEVCEAHGDRAERLGAWLVEEVAT